MDKADFEWDESKDADNLIKHGVSFREAQRAFLDGNRVIAKDLNHSSKEDRYFCFGKDREEKGILTVRFAYRNQRIRIIGAGYWRRGKKIYEQNNSIQ
jgi:uncharacterized DUF497 family protein